MCGFEQLKFCQPKFCNIDDRTNTAITIDICMHFFLKIKAADHTNKRQWAISSSEPKAHG